VRKISPPPGFFYNSILLTSAKICYRCPLTVSLDFEHRCHILGCLTCKFLFFRVPPVICWKVSCPCPLVLSIALPDSLPFVGVVLGSVKLSISISSSSRYILLVIDATVLAVGIRPSELGSIVLLDICVGARIESVDLVPIRFDSRTFQPVASHYTDCAIPAQDITTINTQEPRV
jgi:hypothetical protein